MTKFCSGTHSLSGRTSYRKISRRLEAARFGFRFSQSLWHMTGTSAVAEMPVKFQSDTMISNLEGSKLQEIWRLTALWTEAQYLYGPATKCIYAITTSWQWTIKLVYDFIIMIMNGDLLSLGFRDITSLNDPRSLAPPSRETGCLLVPSEKRIAKLSYP